MKTDIVIDPEFSRICIPATEEQYKALEKSLLEEGCKEPIYIWNSVIVDGHKRYSICSFEEIEYVVKELYFPSRDDAIAWICRKRLAEVSSDTLLYKYLTGKWYRSLRPRYNEMIRAGVVEAPIDNRGRVRTSKIMAQDLDVSYSNVENGEAYAHCMDKIAVADPDIFEALMSGKIKASIREVRLLSQRNRKVRSDVRRRLYPERDMQIQTGMSNTEPEDNDGFMLMTGIKNMPAFDPDMEISGLALTIPTWMASIARAERKTDMTLASESAKKKLAISLRNLEAQIKTTLEAIECTEREF